MYVEQDSVAAEGSQVCFHAHSPTFDHFLVGHADASRQPGPLGTALHCGTPDICADNTRTR